MIRTKQIPSFLSAQRLSASSEDSRSDRRSATECQGVLNAFRHHRKTHVPDLFACAVTWTCSTPFGIIGRLTKVSGVMIAGVSRAQRLSASSEDSHHHRSDTRPVQYVLNAFRHHRKTHKRLRRQKSFKAQC